MQAPKRKQLAPPRQAPAPESTGVVVPKRRAVLSPADLPDPGARAYFTGLYGPTSELNNQARLKQRMEMGQYVRNGEPAVKEVNSTDYRAQYKSGANEMTIRGGDDSDFIAELAHAQQKKNQPYQYRARAIYGNVFLEDSDNPTKGRYGVQGALEQEAHSVIEPQLQAERQWFSRSAARMSVAQNRLGQRWSTPQGQTPELSLADIQAQAARARPGYVDPTPQPAMRKQLVQTRRPTRNEEGGVVATHQHILNPDGSVQKVMRGGERIHSRKHTRTLVTDSLKAKTARDFEKIGRFLTRVWDGHDKAAPDYVFD